jgi:signal transduction histidine kinase
VRLIIENLKHEKSVSNDLNSKNPNNFLNRFTRKISEIPGINKFVYIGEKCIEYTEDSGENIENYFEIFCRCSKGDCYPNHLELDLMINDVTRSKLDQKIKSEFQYKSLFFSKVAHELKNPLICIAELVNQIYSLENFSDYLKKNNPQNKGFLPLENKNFHKIFKTIGRIKSMSSYLILLVKDLEFFSQSQNDTNISIEKKETKLEEVIELCKEIGNSLLKQQNKKSSIKFKIEKSDDVPLIIFTDELRLKQVLINLISNAIKFTIYGEIILKINVEDSTLKFMVEDTGTGINNHKQKNLFKPFNKEANFNNQLGCGLGLSIVRELTKKLGDDIQYKSSSSGTSFWFSIDINKDKINYIKNLYNRPEFIQGNIKNSNNYLINVEKIDESKFDSYCDKDETKIVDYFFNKNDFFNEISLNNSSSNITYMYENNIKTKSNEDYSKLNKKNFKLEKKKSKDSYYLTVNESNLLSSPNITSMRNSSNYNFIIVDDEKITRMSTLRIMKSSADNLRYKINFIEASDGIECLSIFYKLLSQGVKVSSIISDQNMNYLNGTCSAEIIQRICNEKNLMMCPFFLVTAIEKNINNKNMLKRVINKPLVKDMAEIIIKESVL